MSRNISIEGDSFMIDGKPLRIVSGSLHYFRVPAASWRDRLSKLRAAGLNAVSTYVEWSYHEPEERQYDFSGDRDLAQFIRLAAEEGLFVLLRPGPYICAERDLKDGQRDVVFCTCKNLRLCLQGGLPYWLLGKYPKIRLRTTDPNFISETETWMSKLFVDRLTPLLYGNGGPIILVQVENEYGSYGSERPYMERLRDILKEHAGDAALLYTTDGNWDAAIRSGRVPGALTTVDFGTGESLLEVGAILARSFRVY
ncbi:Beta-galactosidase [Eumeta japonica]|uniref:Beta-galactosidase n=1 Tax=Eumeta variegata TaxID=151549 RepID=A0A4C1T9S6_EUMVA|nr:Beta-galactosidase [Eumeta japonica]